MRVLLTGASGYLGSRLARLLVHHGHDVSALLRPSSVWQPEGSSALSAVAVERVSELERAVSLAREHDIIVHAATTYRGRPLAMLESNVALPLALLQGAIDGSAEAFVDVGTCLPSSLNGYALSKAQLTQWLDMVERPEARPRIVRVEMQHYYGPGAPARNFLTLVTRRLLSGAAEFELTDGLQRRDFVHIEDVLTAFDAILTTLPDHRGDATYGLGSGEAHPIRDVVSLLERLSGASASTSLQFGVVPRRAGEPEVCVADTSALRDLGWRPEVGLEDGLADLVESERARLSGER